MIWGYLKAWRAKMRNYQIYPYFLSDGVVLHDTGVGTVPNKQNFASTAKRWSSNSVSTLFSFVISQPKLMENPKVERVYSSNELVGYFHSTIYLVFSYFFSEHWQSIMIMITFVDWRICVSSICRYFVIYEFPMRIFSNGYNHCSNI